MTSHGTRRYQSAAEYATSEMRRLILNGELAAGARIEQEEMADILGTSRLPVRLALGQLQEQGFVEVVPHKGAVVSPLSIEDMNELYSARRKAESWALSEAWGHYDTATIAQLRQQLADTEAAAARDDLETFMKINREFHLSLCAPAGNRYLQGTIQKLFDLSERYQHTSLRQAERMKLSNAHHTQIVDAIEHGTRDQFLEAAARHNAATQNSVNLVLKPVAG